MRNYTAVLFDEDFCRSRRLEFWLVQRNFVVYATGDRREALELARTRRPAVILADPATIGELQAGSGLLPRALVIARGAPAERLRAEILTLSPV